MGEGMNAATALLAPSLTAGRGGDPAILFGKRTITYAELDRESSRFGNAFLAAGLERGDRVLLMVGDRPDFLFAYLGAMKAGGVAVGLNVRLAADDLAFVIDDSGARLLVIDEMFLPLYEQAAARTVNKPLVAVADRHCAGYRGLQELLVGQPDNLVAATMDPDDMAFWLYTSGTTGRPKGAVHRHRMVLAADRFLGGVLGVGPGDRLFCSSKLFFAFALGHCLIGALRLGATVILYEGWPSPEAIAEVVETHRPTLLFSVPTFYRNLLRDGIAESQAFRGVRHFVSAGEKLPESIFERWLMATDKPIIEGIGATETVFLFLANRPHDYRPGSCGRPTPGTEVQLRDEEGRAVNETGVPGLLWVRIDSLAARYWQQPERTEAAFHDGWYCTGDIFVLDEDGVYHHQGRGDDMLKVSGQWVSPAEIEEQVLRHPGISDAAVVGVPNADGLVRLTLFAVPNDPHADTEALTEDVRQSLMGALSIYKCPRRIVLIDQMPRTATGKIQRFLLRQMVADQIGHVG